MDEILISVQTKLAYQEDMLESLNQVIIRQQQQIEALELRCQQLADKLTSLAEHTENPEQEPPPPHY